MCTLSYKKPTQASRLASPSSSPFFSRPRFHPSQGGYRDETLRSPLQALGERLRHLSGSCTEALLQTSLEPPHPESTSSRAWEMWFQETESGSKQGVRNGICLDRLRGLGLRGENTSGCTLSFNSAWGHLALRCGNCQGNNFKSLTVCRSTVRETTEHYRHQATTNRVLMWYQTNNNKKKQLCVF